jgi:hypothetical protein
MTRSTTPVASARASVEGVASADALAAWTIALQTSPTEFYPRFGPLPAVVSVRDQPPEWDVVGRTRTLELSDGGHVVETITQSEPGVFFGYDLNEFQRLFGHLVSGARAEWTFTPEGASGAATRIRWTYAFHPLPGRGWIVRAIVAALWAPYMRRVLPAIIAEAGRRG